MKNCSADLLDQSGGSPIDSPVPESATTRLSAAALRVRETSKCVGRALLQLEAPRSVMIVTKTADAALVELTRHLADWLMDSARSAFPALTVYVDAAFSELPLFAAHPRRSASAGALRFWDAAFCARDAADAIDFVITLGGDGTVLQAAWLFQHTQPPPIVPFCLGSLGFLTVFHFMHVRKVLEAILGVRGGQGVPVNVRMRLHCAIQRADERPRCAFHVLNELVVSRGAGSCMAQLELFGDGQHLTTAAADGIVVATPTGSTAYSLAAGGALVHPAVGAMLITPIAPHTLSFRPMLLPDTTELRIVVPETARAVACATFDGRSRVDLARGDRVVITASHLPVVTVANVAPSSDWFAALCRCLSWNVRVRQRPHGDSGHLEPQLLSAMGLSGEAASEDEASSRDCLFPAFQPESSAKQSET